MKKVLKIIKILISFIILLVGTFFMFTALWVRRTWTTLSAGSIIFQLQNSLEGTGAGMVKTFILTAVLPSFIILIICVILYIFIKRKNLYLLLANVTGIVLFCCSILLLWNRIGLGNYLKYMHKDSSFIEDNYVSPEEVKLAFPENKRNVIYIYLESMELTYADSKNGGAMPDNLIPNLTSLAYTDGEYFGTADTLNGAYSMYGTDWTMGAMFAETSGLPLIIPIQKNSMFTQDKFFPTVTTFGDILYNEGYKNVFLIGSDAEFGGRDIYYKSHGNYEIKDYGYAKNVGLIPEDYMVFWGYEDEKLFSFAKDELINLSNGSEPFNLTLLTVDTHFEDGYTCRLCEDRYSDPYENVISCSDRQVAAFVEWCKTQDFYDNTTIIISGDHPTMDADFCSEIDTGYDRRVYISIINPSDKVYDDGYYNEETQESSYNSFAQSKAKNQYRIYTTFDLFPTALAAMGVTIEGNRLGLGTNLFSDVPTLLETYGYDEFNTQLMMKSDFMNSLSDINVDSADTFLDDVDDKLSSMDVDFSLEETDIKGQYKVNVFMLSDNPSCLNYIKIPYITLSDETYNYSYPLKYDHNFSITEGKTCYSTYVTIPLTESNYPDFQEEDGFFTPNDKNPAQFSYEAPTDTRHSTPLPSHWTGDITVTLTIETHNNMSFSNWSYPFKVSY